MKVGGSAALLVSTALLGSPPWAGPATPAPMHLDVAVVDRNAAARVWRRSRERVRMMLGEPAFIEFVDMTLLRHPGANLVTCGRVRAWSGTEEEAVNLRFISDGTRDGTYLETRRADFDEIWRARCLER